MLASINWDVIETDNERKFVTKLNSAGNLCYAGNGGSLTKLVSVPYYWKAVGLIV